MPKFHIFIIKGIVQGVGFRPFIYREANKRNLKGYVKNTGQGVEIVADNKDDVLEILENLPPLAKIDDLKITETNPAKNFADFQILFSEKKQNSTGAKIPPDVATCDDCVQELLDKKNRRYQYFFISCTNCGPRFSITEKIPFDRENTSLKNFALCKKCEQEYENPTNRRFHAQTTACAKCGPQLEFYENGKLSDKDPLTQTIELLKSNEIISIKGVGGFFLTCLANKKNITKSREILRRPHKPFAIMVKNLKMAEKFCEINETEKKLLQSPERPIILCQKRNPSAKKNKSNDSPTLQLCNFLSPNNRLGIMLPYSGIHHLIFRKITKPLIVTSANMPGIPIPTTRKTQTWKYILDYNRKITNFSDDSIIKVINKQALLIRRSRGFAPKTIEIPQSFQNFEGDILAVGAEMKNTFAVKKGNQIILSQHLGNTEKLENFANFQKTLEKFLKFTNTQPKIILCDANSNFEVSKFAKSYAQERNIKLVQVQHHLAHVFSVALEHNLKNFAGISSDGVGWGNDEKVWGGEVFVVKNPLRLCNSETLQLGNSCPQRIGHLEYQKLVGGDIANKEPVRFLVGILGKFLDTKKITKILGNFSPRDLQVFQQQAQQNFNCVETSSCGRILDAAAILLGFGEKNHYEGFLAEQLESHTEESPLGKGDLGDLLLKPIIEEQDNQYVLKTTELFQFLVENLGKIPRKNLATFVSLYLAEGLWKIGNKNPNIPLVFSGGCAYSTIMTKFLLAKGVKINQEIPAGDGGISAGQIAYFLRGK